jgi:hypothetical protein
LDERYRGFESVVHLIDDMKSSGGEVLHLLESGQMTSHEDNALEQVGAFCISFLGSLFNVNDDLEKHKGWGDEW